MIRRYCDGCGDEIRPNMRTPGPHGLAFWGDLRLEKIRVQVIVAVDDVWNGGDVCTDCVRAVVARGALYHVDGAVTA